MSKSEEDSAEEQFDYHLDQFLEMMVRNNASDLILKKGSPASFRIEGKIHKANMRSLTDDDMLKLARDLLGEDELEVLLDGQEYDGSYVLDDGERFRVNAFLQRNSITLVFRHIEADIESFSELNLPPAIEKIPKFDRGLVLVTGTTSSGKTTTLSSIVEYINQNQSKHVITIEDPIEFVYEDKKSVITQREVGTDTECYASALKFVLRQDPDVILIGEMRDQETVEAALQAAETGHLVFSTLHTSTVPQTLDRILDFYPDDSRNQVLALLSEYLMAVCGQRLLERDDGEGMVPAVELMFNNPLIKNLIADYELGSLRSAIHQGENEGMQTYDQAIVKLYKEGYISDDEARTHCSKPTNWSKYKKGHYPDVDTGILGGM